MNKSCAAIALLVVGSTPALPADGKGVSDEMETVLVTGEQPGPGLWKVSHHGHVMWVLGSIGAIPQTFAWQTNNLESRITESQEVLYPGGYGTSADIGVFRALTLVPLAFKAAKNPNGAVLKDVLSPETYAKWQLLKQKYLGEDDNIEKYRPMVAEEKLLSAIGKKGRKRAPPATSIDFIVDRIAKEHKVRINRLSAVVLKFEVEKPREILKAVRTVDLAEGECFGRNLVWIEKTFEKERPFFDNGAINAWATGDLETLRRKPADDLVHEDCPTTAIYAAMNRPAAELPEGMAKGFDMFKKIEELNARAAEEAQLKWLEAAEAALAKNPSTFVVLPIDDVLSSTGYLAKLQARGYVVEEPL